MKIISSLMVAALALFSATAFSAEVLDRIIVVVNDSVLMQSDLDRAIAMAKNQIKQRGITDAPEDALRAQVLERLILSKLQTDRAAQAGIRIDDRDLNDILINVAAQNGMNLAEFADAVRGDGMDYLSARRQIRDEVLINRLRQREVESRVAVTDQDVAMQLSRQGPDDNVEYRLSDILIAVPDGASSEDRAKSKAKIEDLLKHAQAGEDFAQLAISNSAGQQALQGGDLDWRRAENMPTVFASAAAKLEIGGISPIFEVGSGYHILKLTDKRGGDTKSTVDETHARHILLTPNAVRDEEQSKLLSRDLYDRLVKGEDFAELAKKYSDDPGSKNSGGDLGFQPPGVFVPEFQVRLDALKPGELSPPFRSKFGWHIASVIERRTRDTTEESKRARARNAVLQRRIAEEYDVWLRRLREDAYVEYRIKSDADAAAAQRTPS
jgi:peptidyl-prolyl cis-trans isomerase SurA